MSFYRPGDSKGQSWMVSGKGGWQDRKAKGGSPRRPRFVDLAFAKLLCVVAWRGLVANFDTKGAGAVGVRNSS